MPVVQEWWALVTAEDALAATFAADAAASAEADRKKHHHPRARLSEVEELLVLVNVLRRWRRDYGERGGGDVQDRY